MKDCVSPKRQFGSQLKIRSGNRVCRAGPKRKGGESTRGAWAGVEQAGICQREATRVDLLHEDSPGDCSTRGQTGNEQSNISLRINQNPALMVVMHRINNPINVGAILRTAEAAGATGAIATQNTQRSDFAKSLRGAMGSTFRLPIWSGPTYEEALSWCGRRRIKTICADVHARSAYNEVDWQVPSALILGPESEGLSDEEIAKANKAVRIPMQGWAESLNVAVGRRDIALRGCEQRTVVRVS